ncbi:hypothetical protein D3C74_327280 [compost metagenome]
MGPSGLILQINIIQKPDQIRRQLCIVHAAEFGKYQFACFPVLQIKVSRILHPYQQLGNI